MKRRGILMEKNRDVAFEGEKKQGMQDKRKGHQQQNSQNPTDNIIDKEGASYYVDWDPNEKISRKQRFSHHIFSMSDLRSPDTAHHLLMNSVGVSHFTRDFSCGFLCYVCMFHAITT